MDRPVSPPDNQAIDAQRPAGISLLDLQIKRHEKQDRNESQLARAVNWVTGLVRSSDTGSLTAMRELRSDIEESRKKGNLERVQQLEKNIDVLVKTDQSALSTRKEVSHYGSGLFKTGALFMPGVGGRVASAFFYGMDQTHTGDGFGLQLVDGGLGVLKGGLMHKAMSSLGAGTIGLAGKGVLIGMAARGLDTGLDRRSYTRPDGKEFSLLAGLSKVGAYAIDPASWLADGATLVVAHGLVKGANGLTGGLVERCRPLATMATGGSFGLTTGALNEIDRQRSAGESLSLSKIAIRSILQGGFDSIAALPGGVMADPASAGAMKNAVRRLFNRDAQSGRQLPQSAALASVVSDSNTFRPHVEAMELPAGNKGESTGDANRGVNPGMTDSATGQGAKMEGADRTAQFKARVDTEKIARQQESQRARYLSDETLADGTRVIHKADGSVVRISITGETSIVQGAIKITRRENGSAKVEGPDGEPVPRFKPKEAIAKHERPLNAYSRSADEIGRKISNFERTAFTLDGVTYASVEAFYTSLKVSDPVMRAEIAELHGPEAKSVGKMFKHVKEGTYGGRTFELGSREHHDLMRRAIEAKFDLNPELAEAFMKTYPRPIIHKTSRPESPATKYPAAVFIQTLTEIRQQLVDKALADGSVTLRDGKLVSARVSRTDSGVTGGEMSENRGDSTGDASGAGERTLDLRSVSDILRSINDENASAWHDLELYARAFEGTDLKGRSFLGGGWNTVRISLQDGRILKITANPLTPEMGNRPFDLPILKRGELSVGDKTFRYFVQPEAMPAIFDNYQDLYNSIEAQGYRFTDPGLHQVGYLEGKTYLIDPFAVSRLTDTTGEK